VSGEGAIGAYAPQMMFLAVRVRNGNDDEMYEVDAGLPNLYQVADLLRALAQSIGDHAEAMESDAARATAASTPSPGTTP